MTRVGPITVAVYLSLLLSVTAVGLAPSAGAQADSSYGSADECIRAKPVHVSPYSWSCYGVNGQWRARVIEREVASSGSGFGAFVTFALFWSLIPFLLAMVIASQRGESRGVAILLTLVLGWIGLAIVYFGQRRAQQVVDGLATRVTTPSDTAEGTRSDPPAHLADDSPEERLRRLERLRVDKLLTETEYQDRRQQILDSL